MHKNQEGGKEKKNQKERKKEKYIVASGVGDGIERRKSTEGGKGSNGVSRDT